MGHQKKSYKKFVATAATATLVASAIVPVASASFTDVAENNEFATNINAAVEAGYVKGYEDGTFGVNDNLKRSHVVIIIGRYLESLGYTSEATTSPWSDVTDAEVIKYGNIVKDAGVFTGYADGTLNGAGLITRENMAVVLDRLAKTVTGTSLSDVAADIEDVKVADLATANTAYQGSIQALRDLGISTADNFNPKGNVKRGQFAKFIVTAVEKIDAIAPTAENIAKEIAAVDATLPAVADIKAENAEAAKAAVEAAKKSIEAIKAKIEKAELTTEEKAELEKAIKAVEAKYDAIVKAADKALASVNPLSVESVSAINAKQFTVTFNKAVDKTSATKLANYKINDTVLKDKDGIVLSEDGKTATITLNATAAFTNNVGYSISVEKVKATTGEELPKYATSFVAADTTAPTVKEVSASAGQTGTKTVKVKFSEPVATAGTFTINGAAASVSSLNADAAKNNEVTLTAANTLTAGQTYTLVAASASDAAGNVNVSQSVTFTVVSDTTAGKLVSATGISETKVKLTFDKEINPNSIPTLGDNFKVEKLGGSFAGSTIAVDKDDKKSLIVTVTNPGYTSSVKSIEPIITVKGLKDINGNTIADVVQNKVTLVKDETKPTFVKATVSDDNKYVLVELSEEIAKTSVDNADATGLVVINEEGVDVTTAAFGTGQRFDGAVAVKADGSALESTDTTTKYIKFYNLAGNVLPKGSYQIKVAANAFDDTASPVNKNDAFTFNVTVSELSNSVLPKVPDTLTALANTVTINYGTAMNATALNSAHYSIAGAPLPTGTTIVFTNTTKNEVKITFPKGAFKTSAAVNLGIVGVQNSAGKALAAAQARSINVTDNTVPTVSKVTLASDGKVVLNFGEVVTELTTIADTGITVVDENDKPIAKSTAVTVTGQNATVTLDTPLAGKDLSKLKVKVVENAFKDVANNNNEVITAAITESKYVSVPTIKLTKAGSANNSGDIKVTVANIADLRAEGVTEVGLYLYGTTGAITEQTASNYTVTHTVAINEFNSAGEYTLPSTLTVDAKAGTSIDFKAPVYVTAVAKGSADNKAFSAQASLSNDAVAPVVNAVSQANHASQIKVTFTETGDLYIGGTKINDSSQNTKAAWAITDANSRVTAVVGSNDSSLVVFGLTPANTVDEKQPIKIDLSQLKDGAGNTLVKGSNAGTVLTIVDAGATWTATLGDK